MLIAALFPSTDYDIGGSRIVSHMDNLICIRPENAGSWPREAGDETIHDSQMAEMLRVLQAMPISTKSLIPPGDPAKTME